MKQIALTHTFDFNLKEVIRGRESRYENLDQWPEIADVDIQLQHTTRKFEHVRRRIKLKNRFSANPVLSGKYYYVIENSFYNLKEETYNLKTHLDMPTAQLSFEEESTYQCHGNNTSLRKINVMVDVKANLVGRLVENLIMKEFKKASERDKEMIEGYLKSQSLPV